MGRALDDLIGRQRLEDLARLGHELTRARADPVRIVHQLEARRILQLPTRREVAERRIGVVDVSRQVDVEGSAGPELVLCSRRARHAESRQQHDECDSELLGPHSPVLSVEGVCLTKGASCRVVSASETANAKGS